MASRITSFLERFGLTEYEARVLDALFKVGEAQAPVISRSAQVPKTRVYDVLERLVSKNLIIEIYGRPKKYKVIEPSKAFGSLLELKTAEVRELEKQTKEILQEIRSVPDSAEEKVLKVKSETDFIKILSHEIEQAKKSVFGFTKIKSDQGAVKSALEKASQKKVNVKLLHKALDPKELQVTGITVKSHSHDLNAFIIDNKKTILALSDFQKPSTEYHFSIWNNNPEMVEMIKHYFEKCWKKAK